MHFRLPKETSDGRFRLEKAADERLGWLQMARDRMRESILEAQTRQTKYLGGKEIVF
jgi:Ribonuclease G/E